ncbi:MAG: peptidase [Chitinophagaceae bacterium]|nr:peptidase [Chitinophagaceae bacterium]
MLTEQEAKKLINKILSYSTADETSVIINGGRSGNIRYARNTVSTSGETDDMTFLVTTNFGKRSGNATGNEFNSQALEKTVRNAEEVARLAPENPEYVSLPGPQQYLKTNTFSQNTADITAQFRANAAMKSIQPCINKNLVAAGYLEDSTGFTAIGNNKGLFGYNKETSVSFSVSVRTKDDKGSGLGTQSLTDASKLDTKSPTEIAMQKAIASASTIEMPPGKYTVILEPAALGFSSFLNFFMASLDARNADEGRSYFSNKGGGTKSGEQLFDKKLTIYSDPTFAELPGAPFSNDGQPQQKVVWVENGVLKNLTYSRYWAEKKGVKAIPFPNGVIIEGGNQSLEEMIKNSDKTILITSTHYMRMVNPQNILITGLTRDGLFYIENGKITRALKNFRFNESPINMFRNLEALGNPVRIGNSFIPPMKIKDFNFTSISDAV